ncbi:MAG: hypothetical protein JO261_06560 [Alphaproteobacteria bacterium]|nr:hypothetical protein [Alphaproteobacteria bacterium]MBV9693346.1 hypothetical protein [Alphaproteobacteria bacterium]
MRTAAVALAGLAVLAVLPAAAPPERYDVKTMNFDLWCQEQAKLPPDRCDKRLPADEKSFEAFRAKVEKYEIPYLQRKQDEQRLNQTIIHDQPLENPIDRDNSGQDKQPTPESSVPQ